MLLSAAAIFKLFCLSKYTGAHMFGTSCISSFLHFQQPQDFSCFTTSSVLSGISSYLSLSSLLARDFLDSTISIITRSFWKAVGPGGEALDKKPFLAQSQHLTPRGPLFWNIKQ